MLSVSSLPCVYICATHISYIPSNIPFIILLSLRHVSQKIQEENGQNARPVAVFIAWYQSGLLFLTHLPISECIHTKLKSKTQRYHYHFSILRSKQRLVNIVMSLTIIIIILGASYTYGAKKPFHNIPMIQIKHQYNFS